MPRLAIPNCLGCGQPRGECRCVSSIKWDIPKTASAQELQEYWHSLACHDWDYDYSDDHHVWTKGHDSEAELRKRSDTSRQHRAMWKQFQEAGSFKANWPLIPLQYFCDRARHMVCHPFSLSNLHRMAKELDVNYNWFHMGKFPHYDMPKKRISELTAKCELVTQREILKIVKEARNVK